MAETVSDTVLLTKAQRALLAKLLSLGGSATRSSLDYPREPMLKRMDRARLIDDPGIFASRPITITLIGLAALESNSHE
jgi:hypothetical protein